MYTMLTGRPPFVGKTTLEVIHKHKYGTYDRPSRYVEGIPRRLEEIVCQLLEKEPDERFPDALVLSKRLEEIVRRADVADQEETRVADTNTPHLQSAEVHVKGESRSPVHDVGGTLVRDLVRADIERTLEGSALSKFFNNTWVLLGLFVLLLGGGIAWFKLIDHDSDLSDVSKANAAFRQARNSLEIQLNLDPSHEAAPVLRQAISALEVGDAAKAERLLVSMQYLLADSEGQEGLREKVNEALAQIQSIDEPKTNEIPESIPDRLLKQADRLWESDKESQARMLWKSVIDVYGDDPEFEAQVQEANQRLHGGKMEPSQSEKTSSEPMDSPSPSENDSH
jgi:serine/threonine-protein kinase